MRLATLLLSVVLHATNIAGTFNLPNGTGVNGTLRVVLPGNKSVRNTCTTTQSGMANGPGALVPQSTAVQITNGVLGTLALYPTDCLSPWTLYDVSVVTTTGQIIQRNSWYVTGLSGYANNPSGAVLSTTTYANMYPGGVAPGVTSSNYGVVGFPLLPTNPSGLVRQQTGVITTTPTPTMGFTFQWSTPFVSPPSVVVCSFLSYTVQATPGIYVSSLGAITATNLIVGLSNPAETANAQGVIYCMAIQ